MEKLSVTEILRVVGQPVKLLGRQDRYVTEVSPIDRATADSVTFCRDETPTARQMVADSRAGVIIGYEGVDFKLEDIGDKTLILVKNPRLAFIRIMQKFSDQITSFGISPSAVIEEGALIDPGVYIGPHCYIGRCIISEGTFIYGNNYIYSDVEIGRNVIIHPGAVVGAEGLGFERTPVGKLEKMPQIGGVTVGDDVEIGANTTIMRGALTNTIIGEGTKIGNLCYVGHNDIIGKHCLIVNQCTIGGSATIGDRAQVSLGACIRNKVKIGRDAVVGMGSVVTRDVADGKTVLGVPAREINE